MNMEEFNKFLSTIEDLFEKDPWLQAQTQESLAKHLESEAAEVLDAFLNQDDPEHIKEELGDVLFLVVVMAQTQAKNGHYTLVDVLRTITAKMVRRNPHVFSGDPVGSTEEQEQRWKAIKQAEKNTLVFRLLLR